jgi:hypothetical protein
MGAVEWGTTSEGLVVTVCVQDGANGQADEGGLNRGGQGRLRVRGKSSGCVGATTRAGCACRTGQISGQGRLRGCLYTRVCSDVWVLAIPIGELFFSEVFNSY